VEFTSGAISACDSLSPGLVEVTIKPAPFNPTLLKSTKFYSENKMKAATMPTAL
jgi:hypothetical protein